MIDLFPARQATTARVTRRQWLRMASLAASSLGGVVNAQPLLAGVGSSHPGKAKRCIYIFLCGGPSQPDLWDMKPEAPSGLRSEFQPIQTSVPGIVFSELLPQVSRHADKLALIRSMTHDDNGHGTAIARSLLGMLPPRPNEEHVARDDHPGLGAILHKTLGGPGRLPAWVVLPRSFTTSSPPYKGQAGGFLGTAYDPLVFDKEKKGSLSDDPLRVGSLELLDGTSQARLAGRCGLRENLARPLAGTKISQADEAFEQAFHLLLSPEVRSAMDLEREPARVRDRYGRNEYGQSFLMARRLVQSGVRFVNVFWTFFDKKGCQFNLWDNHGSESDACGIDGQLTGRQQLTHQYCTPSFDRSFSALLEDLAESGMLDDTLVVVAGEFGRTPRINKTAGRDHWAPCYTQLLAGGGVRGGQVWGASDAQGAYVKDAPVTPDDFAATILHAFGLEAETPVPDITGRPVRVTTGRAVTNLF
ncbi:MAG: DUF1501 domain-containing protein [Planctomycetota bacterium]|nr:DUF1501 domain-containing protein [Planctomycetota bacterium]